MNLNEQYFGFSKEFFISIFILTALTLDVVYLIP